ncbi:MAG: UDP-N-acetylmuramoyl-L-alanine--D-glutamate ligase [Alphaproteobacteria bacterium]|nr:UDP-N-acetylmuramoyl-L-alanine--D-glutamate ligase [Alphaproteobacteria bacterium]
MIPVAAFTDRRVAVLGLARSGLSAVRALKAGGARTIAWDDDATARKAAMAAGAELADLGRMQWSDVAALVLSPGIPLHRPRPHPVAAAARGAGVEIIGDIELFARSGHGARVVGITGTNGKSTTTALTGHLLRAAKVPCQVGGNLGTAALDLEPLPPEGVYVLELSSYGIDLCQTLACGVAVLLNLSPDHIERHGDFAGYAAAKRRLFTMQSAGQAAVVGVDDGHGRDIAATLAAGGRHRVAPIAIGRPVERGVFVIDAKVHDALGGPATMIADLSASTTLVGRHNWQNAAAAVAVARLLGVPQAALAAALATFPGLPHRLELVATRDGVRFVNDSKATNADAAARALASYDTIYWIAGGRSKAGGLAGTEPYWDRVVHVFLVGEAAEAFAEELAGKVATTRSGDLATAVAAASRQARSERRAGAVVLLSPACASFDQFQDFEARGVAFRRMVESLDVGSDGRGTAA